MNDGIRKILFRGKGAYDGKWAEGNYKLNVWYEGTIEEEIFGTITPSGLHGMPVTIDPKTLGQYIGKNDKNGKKIFEDDIVKFESRLFVVHYYKPFAMFMLKGIGHGGGVNGMTINLGECEVVGNAFDNPELLEVK